MADQQIRQRPSNGSAASQHTPTVPPPEECDATDLSRPRPAPATRPPRVKVLAEKERVRVGVEVKAGEGHDDVEEVVLELEEKFGEGVEVEDTVVVGGVERVKKGRGDGDEGKVFDVGVV